jgi:hypothetical protein
MWVCKWIGKVYVIVLPRVYGVGYANEVLGEGFRLLKLQRLQSSAR